MTSDPTRLPSSLTFPLPAGFFPRAEAITKPQFEPSGTREASPSPPHRLLRRRALGPWSPRDHCPWREAGPGCGGVPRMAPPQLTVHTQGPQLSQGSGLVSPVTSAKGRRREGGVDSRAGAHRAKTVPLATRPGPTACHSSRMPGTDQRLRSGRPRRHLPAVQARGQQPGQPFAEARLS